MPRAARNKASDSIFHVMFRSISEVPLYKDDKELFYYGKDGQAKGNRFYENEEG